MEKLVDRIRATLEDLGVSYLSDCVISEATREILRRVEDRLPDGKLYQDVLALRLMVDRAIEERQQQRA